jgi:hypothetical protein
MGGGVFGFGLLSYLVVTIKEFLIFFELFCQVLGVDGVEWLQVGRLVGM